MCVLPLFLISNLSPEEIKDSNSYQLHNCKANTNSKEPMVFSSHRVEGIIQYLKEEYSKYLQRQYGSSKFSLRLEVMQVYKHKVILKHIVSHTEIEQA
jgi:hypothetical protein